MKKSLKICLLIILALSFSLSPLLGIKDAYAFPLVALPFIAIPASVKVVAAIGTGIVALLGLGAEKVGDIIVATVAALMTIPMMLTSWLLWVSGSLLNLVLKFTVIDLSKNLSGITAINTAWSVIRDISNMVFIFALLYIAIGTILGLSNINWKKSLTNVVIAAILINFSLFFTKVIIDASNLVALTFYERIAPVSDDPFASGLASSLMAPLGLTTVFSVLDGESLYKAVGSFERLAILSIGSSIFFVITAFVFLAVSIMFLIRYVNIIFLLILSPIFFLGLVLPGMGEKMRQKWIESLTGQVIFAPLYMILTWIVIEIIRDGRFLGGDPSNANTAGSAGNNAGLSGLFDGTQSLGAFYLVMNFIIIIVFIVATLVISKQVANQGGSIGAKVIGGALGGVAWTSRQTIGRAAKNISESDRLKGAAGSETPGLKRFLARTTLKGSQATARGSLDLRGGLAAAGGGLGLGSEADLGLGKAGGKGGYEAIHKEKVKKMEEFGKSLGVSETTKFRAREEFEQAKQSGDVDKIMAARKKLNKLEGVDPKEQKKQRAELDSEMKKEIDTIDRSAVNAAESFAKNLEDEVSQMEKEIAEIKIPEYKAQREEELGLKKADLEKAREDTRIKTADYTSKVDIVKNKYERQKEDIEITSSVEDDRKNNYIETITSRGRVGINEVPFMRKPGRPTKIWRANVEAAAKLKKKDKKVEEVLKDLLKKNKEIEDKPETDSADEEGGEGGGGEGKEKTT